MLVSEEGDINLEGGGQRAGFGDSGMEEHSKDSLSGFEDDQTHE